MSRSMTVIKNSFFYRWQAIGLLVLSSLVLSSCTSFDQFNCRSERLQLTAITAIETQSYHPGKIVWHDLLTPDVAAAKAFYADLFGWSYQQYGAYTLIFNKGQQIGGMVEIEPEEVQKHEALWLAAMSVADVDKAAGTVESLGGAVLQGPKEMDERGRGVLIKDAQGAQIVLIKAKGGDPIDAEPAIGGWLWDEVWTNVPQATHAFYLALGEYDATVKIGDYLILENAEKWRAGIRPVPEESFKVRWVPVVRVSNPQQITDRVVALGGTVWLYPGEYFQNSDIALIADNTGALLMIQRWDKSVAEDVQ